MISKKFILLYLIFCISAANYFGQSFTNPDSALQIILVQHKGTKLSLAQAIQYGLKNSTAVKITEAGYLAALGMVRRESGIFDPQFFFNFNYQDQKQPTASFFSGAPTLATIQNTYQAGLRMDLQTGTHLELTINGTRLSTNSSFAFLNPEYDTYGSLSFRQPLLNGFMASARENLTISETELEARKFSYDQAILTLSSQVERSYWDLYAMERNYAVQQLTRDQADALLKEAELRAKAGLVGPNEVANAKTFLAEQELALIDQEEQLDQQSDSFAALIGVRPDSDKTRFLPSDNPPGNYQVEDAAVLIEYAKDSNQDLKAAKKEIEVSNVQLNSARWKVLPKVDLVGSIGGNGLSGMAQNVVFLNDTLRTKQSGSFNNALKQVFKRDFPNWNIGVEINIPIGFRNNLGEKDRLEAEVYSAEQHYLDLQRNLEEQVRGAWRELLHGKKRMDAALEGVKAAQEQVRIGMLEYHIGRSTAFELVRLGADLAAAQQRYSEALVRTAKAVALLKQLTSGKYTGTI